MSDFKEVGEDFGEGVRKVRDATRAAKLLLSGVLMAGIGISQAIFGWIGKGFVYRVLYPIPLVVFGMVLAWLAAMALKGEPTQEVEGQD